MRVWGAGSATRRSACPVLRHSESGSLVYLCANVGPQRLLVVRLPARLSHTPPVSVPPWPLESSPPRCLSLPLLPVWMYVFLFYLLGVGLPCRWIFCQFWLCEEVQCVYLRRHLGSLFTQLLESVCLCLLSNMGHFQAYFLHHFSMLLSLFSRTLMVTVSHLCYFLQVSGALVTFFPTVSVLVNFISSVLF